MHLRRCIAVVGVLAVLVAALPAGVAARGPQSDHARVVAYWTPERMASAKPRDFVRASSGAFRLAAKPGPQPTASGSTGASWTKSGLVLRASGRTFFTIGDQPYLCSGSVATDVRSGVSLVLTAAHCAYDHATGFVANWVFVPEFDTSPTSDCGTARWGCWTASALVVHDGYAAAGGFTLDATTYDYAFAVVGPGGREGTELDGTVGRLPIAFAGIKAGQSMYAFGYPMNEPWYGGDLAYCTGKVVSHAANVNRTWGMHCAMGGGSSGGPWLARFSEGTGTGTLGSLNSYGYANDGRMYGPKFDGRTQAVYNAANSATDNTIVR